MYSKKIKNKQNYELSSQRFLMSEQKFSLGLTLFFFFVLFGPKVGGYIDTSILVGGFSVLIFSFKKDITFNKKFVGYIFTLGSLLIYVPLIMLLNGSFDIAIFGRYVRSMISLIAIWTVVSKVNSSFNTIKSSIIIVLAMHALVVILTTVVNPQWQEYIRWFNGYQKKIHDLRSTGLMLGFDMSGLLCNIGFLMVATSLVKGKMLYFYRFLMAIFVFAVLFTSRFSIITMLILMIIFIFYFLRSGRKRFEVVFCTLFIIITSVPVTILLLSTTSVGTQYLNDLYLLFPDMASLSNKFVSSYNNTDLDSTLGNNFNFSTLSNLQIFFGAGIGAGQDPGYTKIIFSIGIIGVILSISWYTVILKDMLKMGRHLKKENNKFYQKSFVQINIVIICMYLIVIFLSFKNNYYFTGTYFELFILEVVLAYRIYKIGTQRGI